LSLRIAIKLAYFNTREFVHGFQIQPNVETIFSVVKRALDKTDFLHQEKNSLDYAGRTDHGVNAIAQVMAFNLKEIWTSVPERFLHRINSYLPKNIRCWAYTIVDEKFHPRFDTIEKSYFYLYILNEEEIKEFDKTLMDSAAKLLLGTHNFVNFSKKDRTHDNYTRTIKDITIDYNQDKISITLSSKSFLWQQCRRICGHLIQVGRKQVDADHTLFLLNNFGRIAKPTPLPPEMLILADIKYKNIEFQEDLSIKLKIIQQLTDELLQLKRKEYYLSFLSNVFKS
jgi:tRNA pseudouridine38-40 synthase